jgi:hypothetical protein
MPLADEVGWFRFLYLAFRLGECWIDKLHSSANYCHEGETPARAQAVSEHCQRALKYEDVRLVPEVVHLIT